MHDRAAPEGLAQLLGGKPACNRNIAPSCLGQTVELDPSILGTVNRLDPPGRPSGLQGDACGIKSQRDFTGPPRQAQKAQCAGGKLRLDHVGQAVGNLDGPSG